LVGATWDTVLTCSYTCNLISCLTLDSAMFDAELAASNAEAKSIAFSSVSGATANRLLKDLYLTEIDGFAEAPFETLAA